MVRRTSRGLGQDVRHWAGSLPRRETGSNLIFVNGDSMHIRSKAYLHFISLWRSYRNSMWGQFDAPGKTSPSLVFTALVLAALLLVLELNDHWDELKSPGLASSESAVSLFVGP
jgi:hypothetical protein